jgi:hypothetical protein
VPIGSAKAENERPFPGRHFRVVNDGSWPLW